MRVLDPANMIGAAAAQHGDRTALICRDRTLTYADLDAAAGRVASGLSRHGVRPGERVTLFSENRWEWVAAYHGILRAGCVVNPVNAMLTGPELAAIVEDCGSAALLASGTCTERIDTMLPDSVRLRVSFDDAPAGIVRLADLLSDGPADWDSSSAQPRDLCSISYTSGTTGHPKGAMQAREALLLNWAYTAAMHARSTVDVVLTALPLPHVYGNCAVNSALMTGATVVLEPRFDATRMLGLVAEHGVTMIEGVPAMYSMMLEALATTVADFTTVTRCTVGGQTISDAVVEAWEKVAGAPLLELWGMTELSGLATTHAAYAPPARGSIGVAFPGTEIRVASLDEVTVDAPEGEDGELMVRGPLVTLGYYGNERATHETIEPDGWMHTGDIARRRGTHFYIVDRLKDMILSGGYNVYPAEIERVLAGHPDVALVGVGRVSDPRLGELAHAYVVPAQGHAPDPDAILAFARTRLAPYKIPKAVHLVAALPTTPSGKIRRRDLTPPGIPSLPSTLAKILPKEAAMELEVPVRELLEQYRSMASGGLSLDDLPRLRRWRAPDLSDGPVDDVEISDVVIEDVPVRLYRPASDSSLPLHVYFHGGGFILGSALAGDLDGLLSRRALAGACLVASVEYRLAPEHRFPAGINDCYAALTGLVADAERHGIVRDAVTVGGASSGGNFAAVIALMARDLNGPALALQLLEAAGTDLTKTSTAWRHPRPEHDTTREMDLAMVDLYLSSLAERAHPYASPLFAPKLDGVAPAYLINAEFDPRRDECEAYAVRLRDAGVQAVSRTMPGHVHGSFGLPNWPPAREWRAEANAVLASANAAARAGETLQLAAL